MSTHSPDNLEPDEPELGGGAGADARWWIVVGVSMALLAGLVGWKVGASSSAPSDDPVDVGFLRDMIDHHDQAVVMAVAALDQSSEPGIRGFGRDILIFQRYEIGRMEQQLSDIGVPRGDPRRQVMAWMGMGMPLAAMPGMASQDALNQLKLNESIVNSEVHLIRSRDMLARCKLACGSSVRWWRARRHRRPGR